MLLTDRAGAFGDRVAVFDSTGAHTYRTLLDASERKAAALLDGRGDLEGRRIGILIDPSATWVEWLWAIWRAGGIAMPLSLSSPASELAHALGDAQASVVVAEGRFESMIRPVADQLGLDLLDARASTDPVPLPSISPAGAAMILSTSGTTGRPKGVVISHGAIAAQISCLVDAWEWGPEDRILQTLPLHHVHGIVNVVGCALWSGATVEMARAFDPTATWDRLASGRLTVYMAVPTVYRRLIERGRRLEDDELARLRTGCGSMRLMVSGSAALAVRTLETWHDMTGHVLLERYGMTEIGMALSNPLHGDRIPGTVGGPLPGVDVRLVDDGGHDCGDGRPGEILVRTPGMFTEYWNRQDATAAAFEDGWFRTGDIAIRSGGVHRILGRSSVDIIKTGGEKVSALEIEDVLANHSAVAEVAVVGIPDDEWGERVVAAVVPREPIETESLREWCRGYLATYKVPKQIAVMDALPRNALGKVVKNSVVAMITGDERE